jgi:hypothetical protein
VEYYLQNARKEGRMNTCEYCDVEYNHDRKYCSDECMNDMASLRNAARYYGDKEYRDRTKGRSHEAGIKRKFGISVEEYIKMSDAQGNRCAICGVHQVELERKMAVDHSHKTGKIRGLLCIHCNLGIGHLQDSVDVLKKAQKYLEDTGE